MFLKAVCLCVLFRLDIHGTDTPIDWCWFVSAAHNCINETAMVHSNMFTHATLFLVFEEGV